MMKEIIFRYKSFSIHSVMINEVALIHTSLNLYASVTLSLRDIL